ncbi:SDR family NAD(P)-dependent oxidoreductase [Pedobacter duraquae]|uniref:NADP-dependent 3-hydroxy acid dehydrogenase YdfG n=1 Tax=Pedobacter duraquae TaxID=425511 RepID=A0A4R6II13_9SPHI|nr:SDR family NAD(P)-dependent oxidoreductase [Pedobacter duraquae]TDO21582.1 NADP-dependent 3-hydroxy acid dehydrogenase YdfG [Pedobacter duraquae]
MENKKVWFVTGASKGLGLSLVKQLLNNGYDVAATSRNAQDLTDALGDLATSAFLPLAMNLQSEDSVGEAIEKAVDYFGHIDIVVNNAGYGLAGGLEELSDKEARANFDVNVFGMLHVIRKVMPHLRKQESGHIFNISSVGGFTGNFPGFGIYCATKFAVHGLTESLAAEVRDFKIWATVVYPGYFRTNFLTEGSLQVPQHPIDAYKSVRDSQQMHQDDINGNQPGDPEKAAAAMIKVAESGQPPVHLFLGQDAYEFAKAKIEIIENDLEQWKETTVNTGF